MTLTDNALSGLQHRQNFIPHGKIKFSFLLVLYSVCILTFTQKT